MCSSDLRIRIDANKFAATGFDLDAYARGAGVDRIFQELFDDGGGAFDDFACGDLVRHEVREDADAAHESIVRVGRNGFAVDSNLLVDWPMRLRKRRWGGRHPS